MTLNEIRSEYEVAILGDKRALKLFYLELRKFNEKHPDILNLSVMHDYADFFFHPTIDRNTVCRNLFTRLIEFSDNQDFHALIIDELKFDSFENDFKALLQKLYPLKIWQPIEIRILQRKFLLLTFIGINQTEFCLDRKLKSKLSKSTWEGKTSFDSTHNPQNSEIYPRKLRINASLEESKSLYELELNESVKLKTAIYHKV